MIEPGTIVTVGPAYRGAGHYAPDGDEGAYTVLSAMVGPGEDYYLARGDRRADLEGTRWELIVHRSRLTPHT